MLVLTTSNITEAIDLAFVDRADIKAYIGPPGLKVGPCPVTFRVSRPCFRLLYKCTVEACQACALGLQLLR